MAGARAPSAVREFVLRVAVWASANPARARRVQVGAAFLAFEGLAFLFLGVHPAHAPEAFFWAGFPMVAAAAFLLLAPEVRLRLITKQDRGARKQPARAESGAPTLAERIMGRVTLRGRLIKFFPVFGLTVLAFDLLYNRYLTSSSRFLTNDFAVLALGGALVAYRFFPPWLARERNFLLFFFAALTLIFGVPLIALRLHPGSGANVDEYTATLVTPQLVSILNALGMDPQASAVTPLTVEYPDLTTGGPSQVFIATECSGLYSMGIFMAAFAALVLTEYTRVSWRVGALLAAGILFAYVANLLRMVIIVEVGHFYGRDALLWTHANLGDVIFLLWVAPFVWLTYRVLDPAAEDRADLEAGRFEKALKEQGIDPAAVSEADWFCARCYTKVAAPEGRGPENCPSCGAALG